MQLRYPAVPLITCDPYFSVWSMADRLYDDDTKHWTGKPQRLTGYLDVDGTKYRFMGRDEACEPMEQVSVRVDALSTYYTFACASVVLTVTFTTPLLLEDLLLVSRPVSYVKFGVKVQDGRPHRIRLEMRVDDELALNYKGEYRTVGQQIAVAGLSCARVGSAVQQVLAQCGDDQRLNWGYVYLAAREGEGAVSVSSRKGENGLMTNTLSAQAACLVEDERTVLFSLAYDDVHSLEYFGEAADAYWKTRESSIEAAIQNAMAGYETIFQRCCTFAAQMRAHAVAAGGEQYADLLDLAYRQAIAAHKLCVDREGRLLFVSKECFSNGCAATVDVSLPTAPLFLLYRPELVEGMLRPVFRYADSPEWPHPFAPHDVGTYPILNGQVYGGGTQLRDQMPVEECGNMLILTCSLAITSGSLDLALAYWQLLEQWADYLVEHTFDTESQLCTDDFAGHLAQNANLSLKGIMGITGFSLLCQLRGDERGAAWYRAKALELRDIWLDRAANPDGTFKLAFDADGTNSLKYNLIWDILWGSGIFSPDDFQRELASYVHTRLNPYGVPLDNRAAYSKPEWMLFCAAAYADKADFEAVCAAIWRAYHETAYRAPLMDWYDTQTAAGIQFRNRSTVGGFFIELLKDSGRCGMPALTAVKQST